ncbi:hypothetical protein [Spirosoma arcticum]
MQSVLRFRFVGLALLLSTTLFTACKKQNVDPQPADAATQAAGQYTYSKLSFDGKTLPASQTNLKGTISVTRQTGSTVTMALDIRQKSDNEEFMVLSADGIDVSDAGSGTLSFRYAGEQIGTLKGNKLTINGEDDNSTRFTIRATK